MDLIGNGAGQWWSRALTLSERATRVRAREAPSGEPARDANDRPAIAGLDRWRRQRPFDRPEYLARRLAMDALSERTFGQTLAADPDESANDIPPAWVQRVDDARRVRIPDRKGVPTPSRDAIGLDLARAMVEPLVVAALRRVLASAARIRRDHPDAPFEPERATQLFEPALWNQLVTRCMKVGILELNVARVQGTLVGETPEARYADFARRLRTTDLRDRIFEEYPVLARALVTASDFWEASSVEFLERLAADAADLRAEFAPGQSLGLLTDVVVGAGDVHRHGRSVMIAAFSSGTRVVYKPRSLAAEVQFERLVAWLNDRGQSPPLHAVQSIDRGTHGWAAFAAQADCASPDAVGRFYERFGSYVALLHVLEATDFHYENVIAAGEHPVLVDLEALFHPRYSLPPVSDEPEWIGWRELQQSVLRAGVLPIRAYANEESAGIDVSALGGGGGQQTPNRFPVLVHAGTDAMRLERAFVTLPESQNRPALGGERVDPARYGERIIAASPRRTGCSNATVTSCSRPVGPSRRSPRRPFVSC